MNKVKIAIGVIVCTLFVICVTTMNYIVGLHGQIEYKDKQILELTSLNKEQKKETNKKINELKKELKHEKHENEILRKNNSELSEKNKKIEKRLSELGFPTGDISGYTPVRITMTFYGDFAHENGGYAGIDANGNKLVSGTVASNYYKQGTKFICNGRIYTVRDRGGSNFNNPNRLDVFVARHTGESNASYSNRISNYGIKTVTMYKG